MSARRFYALGTASQVPTRERNHNGYFLRWDDEGILFDPGEGTQRQLIFAGISASQITRICITHFHGDHCLGLAGVLQRLSLDRVPQTIDLHYPAYGRKYVERLRYASIYYDALRLRERPFETPGEIHRDAELSLSALELDHSVESWGYRLQEHDSVRLLPDKLAAVGLRGAAIGELKRQGTYRTEQGLIRLEQVSEPRPGQAFAFVMDTRLCPNAVALARGVDLLVCEATYLASESSEASANGHLTAGQAAGIAREAGARRLVLTHFSQRYGALEPFVQEAGRLHPQVVAVADGDTVDVPPRA